MDPELTTLAQSAGVTLVGLMATDAWERARDGVVTLWQRARPERADAVAAELTHTRDDLTADSGVGEELAAEWQGRIRRLLTERPEVAADLRALLDELAPGERAVAPTVAQRATASGSARVYQAGRDQHITER
ncbi:MULTISPECIES: hypothetical protein [Streptomyces]|uniref:hypothetical protein n=1 Tax=Streptomyces TaxID=1883 RepID=UPI0005B9B072|nr:MULTISPECIES: hypothetical protein [Streptomyces]MDP9950259.1 hypothetical protein [Streptomyces sp. DSM 41269]